MSLYYGNRDSSVKLISHCTQFRGLFLSGEFSSGKLDRVTGTLSNQVECSPYVKSLLSVLYLSSISKKLVHLPLLLQKLSSSSKDFSGALSCLAKKSGCPHLPSTPTYITSVIFPTCYQHTNQEIPLTFPSVSLLLQKLYRTVYAISKTQNKLPSAIC